MTVTASTNSSPAVQYMQVYVDNQLQYTTYTTSLSASIPMTVGKHDLVVQAYNGTFMKTPLSVTIIAPPPPPSGTPASCTPTSTTAVTVCTPTPNATVASPMTVTASTNSSPAVQYMQIYVDNQLQYTTHTTSLSASIPMTAGKHYLVVQAYNGGFMKTPLYVTITAAPPTPSISISPSSTTLALSGTWQFTTSVTDEPSTAVSWTVDSVAGGDATTGIITVNGLYTAPGTPGTHTVTATSNSDASLTASATVTVANNPPSSGVYTYKYDNGRTGLNSNESKLTVAAVTNGANFGKLGTWTVDGSVYTQPLYVPGVSLTSGTYNVLYVGTENDSIYALNADVPGSVLWKRSFLTATATIGHGYTGGRTSIGGNVGITGTPVIDPATNWMYVVVRTTEGGNQVQRLHAIDITTGADVLTAAAINPVVSGTGLGNNGVGQVPFLPLTQNQRPALLLTNGIVFVTFASFSDYDPYHGWVIAFDATSLDFIDAYNATPNGGGGGSWMAGAGPAGDSDGNVYFATGNGRPDATALFDPPNDLPNSFLKLNVIGGKLTLVDYFSPYNAKCLSADDLDLGSSGPTLIPDQFAGHSILALGSKEGRAYLLDQNDLGKFHAGSDSQILSSVLFNPAACGQAAFNANAPLRVYGSPAYWNGNIYFGSAFGPLRQYNISNGTLVKTALSAHLYPGNGQTGRGPLTIVSANGTANAIVWTAENDLTGKGWLRAFDATNVANQLYFTNFGAGGNFIIPMVINGNLYVTGQATVYKYGLLH